MDTYDPFLSLAVSMAIGFIVGLEREQSTPVEVPESERGLGGARTYPLVALSGSISTLLARESGAWILAVSFTGLLALVVAAYVDDLRKGRDRGITSEIAILLTFLLGILAVSDGIRPTTERLVLVSALGVGVATLLSLKTPLHGLAKRISRDDIYATLKFLIVAVIVLPLLPDRPYGPLDALNPFHIGMMVVLIAGLSFVGYVAVRVLGPGRGLGLTGLIGGLVSSTAVTLSMSARAKRDPGVARACVLAVVLASTVMFLRVLIEVAVVHPGLVPAVSIPIGSMALGGFAASLVLYAVDRKTRATSDEVRFANPFELTSAIKFGLLFALVLVAAKAATRYFGEGGSYVAGVLAGTTDVDAITLSMANLAKGGLDHAVAATTILLATASNTIVKASMAVALGGKDFGKKIALALFTALVGGGVGLWVMWMV